MAWFIFVLLAQWSRLQDSGHFRDNSSMAHSRCEALPKYLCLCLKMNDDIQQASS